MSHIERSRCFTGMNNNTIKMYFRLDLYGFFVLLCVPIVTLLPKKKERWSEYPLLSFFIIVSYEEVTITGVKVTSLFYARVFLAGPTPYLIEYPTLRCGILWIRRVWVFILLQSYIYTLIINTTSRWHI